ncbi:MAG: molecular chaperone DnaJ [Gaiellaceae bacterium]
MATTERDYYELLGIPRQASEAEIKKAFRRLARELHPDVSDDPDAEQRFKQVVEAYEVLSKPESRELYDRFGHAGLRSGGFQPSVDFGGISDLFSAFFGEDLFGGAPRRRRGADVLAQVEIELAEAAAGVTRAVPFGIEVVCQRCKGDGVEPGTKVSRCATCAGNGVVQHVTRSFLGQIVQNQTCPSCAGSGRLVEHPCETCEGRGRETEERRLDVEIPAGIHDGQRIRIGGEGHAGLLGGGAGDAYILVRVLPDERFVREGEHLISNLELTMTQAALGGTLEVPTLDGDARLEIAPGAQPGQVLVLRGKGMPRLDGFGRGDLRVIVNVLVPRKLDEEQRRLLEQFEESASGATYERDEGLFARLKSVFR